VISGCSASHHHSKKHANLEVKTNEFWWPKKVNLSPLRQHANESNPYGKNYNYAKEINNHFCKDCCKGDKLKCKQCNKLIGLDKDWKGNFKLICIGCWKINKNKL
jgi:catalase (peroxidase I)